MKSVGIHGSSSLLYMMKVMVWHFVGDTHKVIVEFSDLDAGMKALMNNIVGVKFKSSYFKLSLVQGTSP